MVRADEKLTAFVELESAICAWTAPRSLKRSTIGRIKNTTLVTLRTLKGVTKIILLTLKEAEEVTTASLMVRRGGTRIYTVLIS